MKVKNVNPAVDLKTLELTIPGISGWNNWAAIRATQVTLGIDSWLVVSFDEGQDDISPESVAYSTPSYPPEWVNRWYEDEPVSLSYEWEDPFFRGRTLMVNKIFEEDENNENKKIIIYKLTTPGCGAIENRARIFLNGVEVEKRKLPKLDRIYGVHEMFFYRQYYSSC